MGLKSVFNQFSTANTHILSRLCLKIYRMRQKSRIARLPEKILRRIEAYLPEENVICWALTCRMFWKILAHRHVLVRARWKAESLSRLLHLLEPDLPQLLPCDVCLRFHSRDFLETAEIYSLDSPLWDVSADDTDRLIATHWAFSQYYSGKHEIEGGLVKSGFVPLSLGNSMMKPTGEFSCEGWAGAVKVYDYNSLAVLYKMIQLVLRHYRFGPEHGIPAGELSRTSRPIATPISKSFTIARMQTVAKVIDSRLFFQIKQDFRLDLSTLRDPYIYFVNFICCRHSDSQLSRHFIAYFCTFVKHLESQSYEHWSSVLSCATCRKPRRCNFCATEILLTIKEQYDALGTQLLCRLSVWRDLGSVPSSKDPLWRSHWNFSPPEWGYEDSMPQKLNWAALSYGSQSLGDIFDAGTAEGIREMKAEDFVTSEAESMRD